MQSAPAAPAAPHKRSALLPLVDTGCCCELETCCRVQGWCAVVGGCLGIWVHMWKFWEMGVYLEPCRGADRARAAGATRTARTQPKVPWFMLFITDVANVAFICVNLLSVVCAWHFIKGIKERRPEQMVLYIRSLVAYIAVGAVITTLLAILDTNILIVAVGFPLYAALPYYMLICASSLHVKMTTSEEFIGFPSAKAPLPHAAPATGYAPPGTGYISPETG